MKKFEVEKAILVSLGVGALLVTVATAPGILGALGVILKIKEDAKRLKKQSMLRAIQRLKEERKIDFVKKNGQIYLEITERGKKRLRQFEFQDMRLEIPKRLTGGWTVILFDIPETRKTARDALRMKLYELGCFQYHKSVFVHPANCGDEIDFISDFFQIGQYVAHFRAPALGQREHLVYRHFAKEKEAGTV